ncbi:hypothetical protein H740_10157 [Campylobacter showae CC57C]|jgi:hypothetical protein|uniref:Uncharacterized protein n=1 Tax=Campylobacter showae CC57C TaxID=1073353 RepID=M3JAM8_9BACT|nr:hypothetical protein H740_10157 [Campylobacter showae CC57C]
MQASFIVDYIEPLITVTALFFTIINWIISQRLNAFNQKLSLFEKSFGEDISNLEKKIDKIYDLFLSQNIRLHK